MKTIDLRSDTLTRPSRPMREYMMYAEVGDDVFAEDPTINQLQSMIAEMTGKEAALFVTSGTQANQISINAHTQPGDEVICDYNAHIFNYESGAAGMLSGVQLHPVTGRNGHPTVEQIEAVIRPFDDHYPQTKLICLENTHNRAGGTVFPIEQIAAVAELVEKHRLKMHLDGARLWNAAIATGLKIADYAQYFDSVALCFSKGLGAPAGSIIAGSKEFIKRAHFYRKACGGGMRQAGILAAAAIYAVENHFELLKRDHEHARLLAEALNDCPGISVNMEQTKTNIVIAELTDGRMTAEEMVEKLAGEGILVFPFSPVKVRFVTHLDVSRAAIEEAVTIIHKLFGQGK